MKKILIRLGYTKEQKPMWAERSIAKVKSDIYDPRAPKSHLRAC